MGAVKVNNDEVWNDYVKTGKVKGFSIEGYFADKMERPKESIKEDMSEKQADLLLSQIEKIVKGEKVELANVKEIPKYEAKLKQIQKGIRDFESFKNETKPEILKTVKWLNQFKAAVVKIGLKYSDVKGLNEINDLYYKVNSEAKSAKII
jgi:hypothetical protein